MPSGRIIPPGEDSSRIGDNGDPVATAELDRILSIHVHVRKHPEHLGHRRGMRLSSVDRLCKPCDKRDPVRIASRVCHGQELGQKNPKGFQIYS